MVLMTPNPYRPGAGTMPAYLAGRQKILHTATQYLDTIAYGYPARSVVFYGLRGVGKTVILSQIENLAIERDIPVEYMEIPECDYSFQRAIALHVYKLLHQLSTKAVIKDYVDRALRLLKAFTIKYSIDDTDFELTLDPLAGNTDSGNLTNDVMELFLALGLATQKAGRGAVLLIDEIQFFTREHFEVLMQALHRVNQKGYSFIIFAAGLPKILRVASEIKSYSERLFKFIEVDTLDESAAALALTEPARAFAVSYEPAAVDEIMRVTCGYPYFIQVYGSFVWEARDGADTITAAMVHAAYSDYLSELDEAFYRTRAERATAKEMKFMLAMVRCMPLPCSIKSVASDMHMSLQSISPLRAQLIHKGFIYATARGMLDFTVPQFDLYLKRTRLEPTD